MHRINLFTATLLTAACLLLACAGTAYQATADIKMDFGQYEQKVVSLMKKVTDDLKEKEAIHLQLEKYVAPDYQDKAPYPRLKEAITAMRNSFRVLQQKQARFTTLQQNLDRLTRGKSKLSSNQAEWDPVQTIQAEAGTLFTVLDSAAGAYLMHSQTFVSNCTQFKIMKVNVVEIKKKVYSYIGSLDKAVGGIEAGITRQRKQLALADPKKLPEAKKQEMQGVLNQLEGIKNVVSKKRFEIQKLLGEFEREAAGHDWAWAGPGMRTFTINDDVQRIGKDIMNLNMQFKNVLRLLDIIKNKK